ncbi:MAG: AMP-binding protein, partial [Verrucomicrobiales bacterium]
SFGRLLEREAVNLANYQEGLLLAREASFSRRPILECHLAYALLRGLKRHAGSCSVVDGLDGLKLRFDKLLAISIALAKVIRKETGKKRVGIILPPGRAGLLANLAVLLAGKIPVNLNFTTGAGAVESAIRQADLDRFITVDAFVRKMGHFPWPPTKQILFLERVIPALKVRIVLWLLLSRMLSARALAMLLSIPRKGEGEAVLLFTSGSSGEPKGVPLSHRNLLANVNQFSSRLDLNLDDSLLACLPLFHSFGSTVTLWYPIIEGVDMVTYPNPLEAGKLAKLIDEHGINLVLATPTFLRGYLRKATREQLSTTSLIVTGAEKLPPKTAEAFEKRFGKPVLEGYGLTETSPVTNVNLPDPRPDAGNPKSPVIPATRPGSVGQMLPGIGIRITDPDTGELFPLHRSGMIWLKGANIFEGYLDNPDLTKEVIQNGWLRTGDIGRMDEDGFLYIEGRLSRFSKIAGEMVPHETIEHAITKELELDSEHERKVAIVGLPDDTKGEVIVLLTAIEGGLDATELRYRLLEAGVPNLWIPRTVVQVESIPMLASGKLDIKSCEEAAGKGTGKKGQGARGKG